MFSDREPACQIAVVGDVHDLWDAEADEQALKALGVDLVLFVGDFGNESVEVVRAIAQLDLPKAIVFGNHDAWYSASEWGRKKCPYNREREDRVQQQLDLLGNLHVGYGKLDYPQFQLSVVGSRPFSWGGSEWKNQTFYRDRFGVTSFAESTSRIVEAAAATAEEITILLGHNGPYGLGDRPEDSCGRDWHSDGGDYGDRDLADAIPKIRALGKTIPLVAFGHMHHHLRHTRTRLRTIVNVDAQGTVYLNAARTPRIDHTESGECQRNFSLVALSRGQVREISLVWLGADLAIASREILYRQDSPLASSDAGIRAFGEDPVRV